MNDARQNPSEPFHGWSPFGLLPVLIWPAWASLHLPEHFRGCPSAIGVAPAGPCQDTGKIVNLEDYRRRRLAKRQVAPSRIPAAAGNDRSSRGTVSFLHFTKDDRHV